ncbi:uncharacterized protein LOC110853246 [Folsomia candida]|uniref:Uncharacterized protein n=1 Tax=Folsomia candida TaxID=158441 RepID=A0A226DZR2_FOLCA|nr:uncharacterized protein LOC110853246 [Folsomia candida]OXA50985.1 hypothetical protein Fcan01_14194 [Folsomia candida]
MGTEVHNNNSGSSATGGGGGAGNATATMAGGEFVMMKDTVWKLSSRVLLLEGFIKQQFGNVFWQFCEDQVKNVGDTPSDEDEDGLIIAETKPPTNILPMPPMIPIQPKARPRQQQAQQLRKSSSTALTTTSATIPPPPPLSRGTSPSSSTYQTPKARNFLPKSLTAPKLPPSITITPTNTRGNGITTGGQSILKEKIPSENHHHISEESQQHQQPPQTIRIKSEPKLSTQHHHHQQQRRSPALIASANRHQHARLSTGSITTSSIPAPPTTRVVIPPPQLQQHYMNAGGGEEYGGEFYQGESEESEEDSELYGDGGYLAAELVSATLCPPEDTEDSSEICGNAATTKKIRLSLSGTSSSSSSFLNGNGNGGGQRQMRPNPCHARCQNRCHDIWTDGDRMGVFHTYWALPSEEERREFVASRIERVDMATKRTEFSNFRTCTFKYYLPHPDNPWVQVCKNFFLATIDEKRSYIEKIAQSVKGEAGEKVSAKNIPFRRRNQMQRSAEEMGNYAGWMQGLGLDPSLLDEHGGYMVEGDVDGEMVDGEEGEDQDGMMMGVEMMEDEEEESSQQD